MKTLEGCFVWNKGFGWKSPSRFGDRDKKAHGRNRREAMSSLLRSPSFALQTYQLSFTIGKPKKIALVARPWCKEGQEATIHEASGQIQTQVAECHNLVSGAKTNLINQVNWNQCFTVSSFLPEQEPTRIVEGQPIWGLPCKSGKQWQNFGIRLSPQKMEPRAAFWKSNELVKPL